MRLLDAAGYTDSDQKDSRHEQQGHQPPEMAAGFSLFVLPMDLPRNLKIFGMPEHNILL